MQGIAVQQDADVQRIQGEQVGARQVWEQDAVRRVQWSVFINRPHPAMPT